MQSTTNLPDSVIEENEPPSPSRDVVDVGDRGPNLEVFWWLMPFVESAKANQKRELGSIIDWKKKCRVLFISSTVE